MGLSPQSWEAAAFASFSEFWADRTPISLPNQTFDREKLAGVAPDAAYVELAVRIPDEGEERVGSSGYHLRRGFFAVFVFVRAGASRVRSNALIGDALQWFRSAVVPETVFSRLGGPVEIGSDGAWYQVNATARFVYVSDTAP